MTFSLRSTADSPRSVQREYERLIRNRPEHWTQYGLCAGDERFTGKREGLTKADLHELSELCTGCEVFDKCQEWATTNPVIDVYAAGEWR